MLLSLFLVRGPLGLRMLWRSERFERSEKKFLTVLVVVYSAVLIAAFYYAARMILEMFAA